MFFCDTSGLHGGKDSSQGLLSCDAAMSSETLVSYHNTLLYHTPEGLNLNFVPLFEEIIETI
jgi:hypothetical protein